MDSPGRPVAFSAVRLGEWTRLEQGAFAKWMVGCPAHSGDTNRPGNTRNGFGGLTLCPSLGESFRKPVPRVAVSLCACGATPQPVLRQGFSQTLRQPQAVPR